MNFFIKKTNVTYFLSILIVILSIISFLWIRYFKEITIPLLKIQENDAIPLSFDYIIVGAGTAGSVLGTLLSENNQNRSVLIIEAGHTFSWTTKVPLLATFSQKSNTDWGFITTPQLYSSNGIRNNQQYLPRGKGLGGSSQINYLLHYPGQKKDFDKLNLKNWNYDVMKKYLNADDNKSLNIWEIPKNYSYLTEAFENLNIEFKNNNNLKFQRSQYTIKNGIRSNVYQIYLQSNFINNNNNNLKILTNTLIDKIEIKNHKANSVIFNLNPNKFIKIKANIEIILSAGAYQTPQILHRSGIGPQLILQKLNIPIKYNSPKIGKNLYDHMNLPLYVSIEKSASITVNKILNPLEIWKYLRNGHGHFSNFGVIGNIIDDHDDYGINIFATGSINEKVLMDLSNFKLETFRSLFPLYFNESQEGFVILSTCLQPKSRGHVQAKSKNCYDDPLINPNYLHLYEDIECMIRGIRTAIKIITSKSFQFLNPKIYWPKLKECIEYGPTDQDFITNQPNSMYIECLIRHVGLGSHHPGGTCAMGGLLDEDSPLDEELRIRGVKNLRVVDASILPTPISGTPNSVLIAVARRAAHLILTDNG